MLLETWVRRVPESVIKPNISLVAGLVLAIVVAGAATGAARAEFSDDKLPDGRYRCEIYLLGLFLTLGDIAIKGNIYSGPDLLGIGSPAYTYQMDANGEITWLGPLGGYTSGGNSVSLTQATLHEGQPPSFDIIMKQPDGNFTASTCTKRP